MSKRTVRRVSKIFINLFVFPFALVGMTAVIGLAAMVVVPYEFTKAFLEADLRKVWVWDIDIRS